MLTLGFQPTCQPKECTLPSCLCAGSAIPGNIPRHQTPQIILLTFDDAIHKGNVEYIHKLLSGLKNPGNCGDAHLTYFVSNKSTDYNVVNEVYKEGHEIASHSVSHKSVQWFRQGAGRRGWYKEIFDQKKNLEEKGNPKYFVKLLSIISITIDVSLENHTHRLRVYGNQQSLLSKISFAVLHNHGSTCNVQNIATDLLQSL